MIKCKKCKFGVNQGMKFALMKNICPSCGAPLFSQREEADINAIQSRVINQEFASKLEETQIYDISLFIFSELTNGIGQIFIQREIEKLPKRTIKKGEDSESADEEADSELDSIRREIAQEVGADLLPEVSAQTSEDDYDEELANAIYKKPGKDQDDKVKRLKRLARMNNKKSGPAIKRLA